LQVVVASRHRRIRHRGQALKATPR
jgi:hypothetical protein